MGFNASCWGLQTVAVDGEGLPLNCESMVRMKLTVESQTETVSYKIQINEQQKKQEPSLFNLNEG